MSLKIVAELPDSFSSTQFTAVTSASGNFYVTTTEPRVRGFSALTLNPVVSSTTSPGSSPSGIGIINSASAIIVSSAVNQYDFMNLFTGARGSITTNAVPTNLSANNQQVACLPASSLAVVTQVASGGFRLINGNTFSASLVTVPGMTNEAVTSVILRSPSSTFLIGSTSGIVREVTTAGVVLQLANISSSPSIGENLQKICGLAAFGRYVVAVTDRGMMYCLDWDAAGTITDALMVGMNLGASPTISLSNSSSGVFILPSGATTTANETLTEIYINQGKFYISDIFIEESSTATFGSWIDPQTNRVLRLLQSSTTQKGRLFELSSTMPVNVSTRIQYPLGVDVAGTILRIRDCGVGSAQVESINSIGASVANLAATDDQNYIEIALYTDLTTFPPTLTWDIREFEA